MSAAKVKHICIETESIVTGCRSLIHEWLLIMGKKSFAKTRKKTGEQNGYQTDP